MSYGKTRPRRNAVKLAIADGRMALGIGVQTNSPDMVEMAAAADFDFVYLDFEHGSFGFDSAFHLIRAAEASGSTGRWGNGSDRSKRDERGRSAKRCLGSKVHVELQWRIAWRVSRHAGYLASGSRFVRLLDREQQGDVGLASFGITGSTSDGG